MYLHWMWFVIEFLWFSSTGWAHKLWKKKEGTSFLSHAVRHKFCCRLWLLLFFLFWRGNKERITKTLGWYSVSDVPLHTFDLWYTFFVRLCVPGRSLTCCPRSAGCRPLVPSTTCRITQRSLPGCRGVSCSQTRGGEHKAEWPLHDLPSLDFSNANKSIKSFKYVIDSAVPWKRLVTFHVVLALKACCSFSLILELMIISVVLSVLRWKLLSWHELYRAVYFLNIFYFSIFMFIFLSLYHVLS